MTAEDETRRVYDHHIEALAASDLEAILADYDDDCSIITQTGTHRGADDVRGFFEAVLASMDADAFAQIEMGRVEIVGDVAFHTYSADPWMKLGTDTFVVRGGKIVCQTAAGYP